MPPVISVESLSKRYIIGHQKQTSYTSLRDTLTNGAKGLSDRLFHPFVERATGSQHEEFWALKDVNFAIEQGDRVGIVGRNGAGKSTLLKVLSRITEPTCGRVSIRGRVASLLEVGTGFHPELSGRENIFLNGAILGMSKAEIGKQFDAIVAFAEVEKFLDTPVKHYSSGMYVRLAFAVAAHLEPEILIVDEVLAVGDAQFQRKCLGKMEEVGLEGRTVIFVSHNIAAIRSLCSRALLLDKGILVFDGASRKGIELYTRDFELTLPYSAIPDSGSAFLLRNESAVVTRIQLSSASGEYEFAIDTDTPFDIEISYTVVKEGAAVGLNVIVLDDQKRCVFGSINNHEHNWYGKPMPKGNFKSTCRIPKHFLNNGLYSIGLNLFGSGFTDQVSRMDILLMQIEDGIEVRSDYFGVYDSNTRPLFSWNTVAEK